MLTDADKEKIINDAEREILKVLKRNSLSIYSDDGIIYLSHQSQHESGDYSIYEQSMNLK